MSHKTERKHEASIWVTLDGIMDRLDRLEELVDDRAPTPTPVAVSETLVGERQSELPDGALATDAGIPMLLFCPACGMRHFDEGEWATKAHHTHACQNCGMVWRPTLCATRGVRFLPSFKNEPADDPALDPYGPRSRTMAESAHSRMRWGW